MVEFGEIVEKTIRVNYTIAEADGCKVTGVATYNKEKKPTRVTGMIKKEEQLVANFNTMGDRINILECDSDLMSNAVEVAQTTLSNPAEQYPE